MWPSLLAIDAPVVAVAWLWAVGREGGAPLSPVHALVMAVSVWLVYTADRLLDTWRMRAARRAQRPGSEGPGSEGAWSDPLGVPKLPSAPTPRHAFAKANLGILSVAWLVGFSIAASTALRWLSVPELAGGAVVLGLVGIALGAGLRKTTAGISVRAAVIGLAFAGATVVLLGADTMIDQWLALASYAAVCAANVLLVSRAEQDMDDGFPARSIPRAVPRSIVVLAVALSASSWIFAGSGAGACAGIAALCLLGLDAWDPRNRPHAFRALADAALILPLVFLVG